jgi:ketosteroid isomerase-like protein
MTRLPLLLLTLVVACAAPRPAPSADLRQQVWDTELAFADTMARRDHAAFTAFLSEEAIFFGGAEPLRGKRAVAEGWAPYFDGPAAPFAWEPDTVEVLASGDLALSSGPVIGPNGEQVGRFNSIWRLEPDGWRVVLDKGEGAD